MISLRNVSKSYHSNAQVLTKINLEVQRGEFLFLVGDSGAGKTTLLKLLSGEEQPTDGTCVLPQQYQRKIGMVYQDYRLIEDRTVFENIAMPLYFGRAGTGVKKVTYNSAKATELVRKTLQDVALNENYLHARVKELSGGEQQRVAIARGLVNFPDYLIADEPTGNLDHDHTWSLMDLFQKLNMQGMTVIVATHDRDMVRKIRRRTCHLQHGRLRIDEREGACIF